MVPADPSAVNLNTAYVRGSRLAARLPDSESHLCTDDVLVVFDVVLAE